MSIYIIRPKVEHNADEIYYGSTLNFKSRKYSQKNNYDRWCKGLTNSICMSYSIFDKYGFDNCEMVEIEKIFCASKEQLWEREKWYIQNNPCLNKVVPIATEEEKKQKADGYKRKYAVKNREAKNLKQKEKVLCEICNIYYSRCHKSCHLKTSKHLLKSLII